MRRSLCTSRVVVGKQLNASSRSFASSVATTKKTFVPASERKEYSMEGPGDLYTVRTCLLVVAVAFFFFFL